MPPCGLAARASCVWHCALASWCRPPCGSAAGWPRGLASVSSCTRPRFPPPLFSVRRCGASQHWRNGDAVSGRSSRREQDRTASRPRRRSRSRRASSPPSRRCMRAWAVQGRSRAGPSPAPAATANPGPRMAHRRRCRPPRKPRAPRPNATTSLQGHDASCATQRAPGGLGKHGARAHLLSPLAASLDASGLRRSLETSADPRRFLEEHAETSRRGPASRSAAPLGPAGWGRHSHSARAAGCSGFRAGSS